jgi:hypothetical protein
MFVEVLLADQAVAAARHPGVRAEDHDRCSRHKARRPARRGCARSAGRDKRCSGNSRHSWPGPPPAGADAAEASRRGASYRRCRRDAAGGSWAAGAVGRECIAHRVIGWHDMRVMRAVKRDIAEEGPLPVCSCRNRTASSANTAQACLADCFGFRELAVFHGCSVAPSAGRSCRPRRWPGRAWKDSAGVILCRCAICPSRTSRSRPCPNAVGQV